MNKDLENRISKLEDAIAGLHKQLNALNNNVSSASNNPVDMASRLSKNELNKIEDIMDNFDFNKVHDVMKMLKWQWGLSTTNDKVPSVEELEDEARRLLVDACCEKTNISTGGFRAVYEGGDDDDTYIGLEFIVEECEGFVDEED